MKRRILMSVALAVLIPLRGADAQPRPLARIGELWLADSTASAPYRQAFRQGLRELGYVEGHNIVILSRFANGDATRLTNLVAELVGLHVDVMLVSPRAVLDAKRATTTIPIVCAGFADPVAEGLVASLAHPGGNVTGLSWLSPEASGKRLELAREVLPGLSRVAVLFDGGDTGAVVDVEALRAASRTARVTIQTFEVRGPRDFDGVFAAIAKARPRALIVAHSPLTVFAKTRIVQFAAQRRMPLIDEARDFADVGGLLTYGPRGYDLFKRGATYVDKILKGAKPADLPVEQPTHFELVINLKTAKALGLTIPQSLLGRADEVIR